jgi:hypothetical protein
MSFTAEETMVIRQYDSGNSLVRRVLAKTISTKARLLDVLKHKIKDNKTKQE